MNNNSPGFLAFRYHLVYISSFPSSLYELIRTSVKSIMGLTTSQYTAIWYLKRGYLLGEKKPPAIINRGRKIHQLPIVNTSAEDG